MENLTVEVRYQLNYGKKYYYPLSEYAHALCQIARKKVLTHSDILLCKQFGLPVIVKASVDFDEEGQKTPQD